MTKVGVISDTHDFFDSRIPKLFAGVEHILHGGDIGLPWLLMDLQEIAPVTSVAGNTDAPSLRYPLTAIKTIAGIKFLLHHIVNPRCLEDELAERIRSENPRVVVFGHTHKPFCEEIDGVLYFNPGYAGKSRFGMPRSVAILHFEELKMRPEFLPLE